MFTNDSTSYAVAASSTVKSAPDVAFQRLSGIALQQRQVLKSGGVEHDLRPESLEDSPMRCASRMSASATSSSRGERGHAG